MQHELVGVCMCVCVCVGACTCQSIVCLNTHAYVFCIGTCLLMCMCVYCLAQTLVHRYAPVYMNIYSVPLVQKGKARPAAKKMGI